MGNHDYNEFSEEITCPDKVIISCSCKCTGGDTNSCSVYLVQKWIKKIQQNASGLLKNARVEPLNKEFAIILNLLLYDFIDRFYKVQSFH